MLKKSNAFKFLIGTFAFALMLAVASVASAAWDFGPTTLKVGSKGEYVKNVQTVVGANVDGAFGPMTKAHVVAWQAAHGLTADGVVGPMTKAAMNASVTTNYPAGCVSNTGYSSTTGMPCNGSGTTLPAGCATAAGFSVTTGQPCTATTVNTGTNGYLADLSLDSTNRVSTVYESETDKVVAGFRATARLASQNVNRVRVTFLNTNAANSSANLSKYISSASLWYGSTKLATMAISQADRATSSDLYTFNFSGINANIPQDQVGRFSVSVNTNGSIDTNDTDATWTVSFTAGGVQAVSPDGSVDTYPANALSQAGVMFNKFSSSGVKATVSLAPSNPSATTISVNSTTSPKNDVALLKFTIKAENSDLTLRRIPVQITSTTANVSSVISTVKLMRDGNLLDSADSASAATSSSTGAYGITGTSVNSTGTTCASTACGYVFANLSTPGNTIAAGTTAEFTVAVDIKGQSGPNYADGETLTAKITNADILSATYGNFSVQDVNGDQLTINSSSVRVGSAVGNTQTLRANGVNVAMGTPSYSYTTATSGDINSVTYTIPVSVTAFGNTLYLGQTVEEAATASASNAFAFQFQRSDTGTLVAATSATSSFATSDATLETNGYRLDSGVTKHFTVTVTLITPSAADKYYRVVLKQVKTFTEGLLVTGTAANLLPVEQFQTDYKFINN